jgi:hypothetical protein
MLPALDIPHIEDQVRRKLDYKPVDVIVLVFAAYAGEKEGIVVDYLRRWQDYNFHSGEYVDLYHVGYARWCDSHPKLDKLDVSHFFGGVEALFYPKLFHEIRNFIALRVRHEWNYEGGIDLLIFPVVNEPNLLIDFDKAIAFRSKELIPKIFRDIDEFARTLFNVAQSRYGRITADDFSRKVSAIRYKKNAGFLAKVFGPKLFDVAAKMLVGKAA